MIYTTFVLNNVLSKVVHKLFDVCAPEGDEISGLDLNQHDETVIFKTNRSIIPRGEG